MGELNTPDHVTEKAMAGIYGTTQKALETRRYRGQIPEGVWIRLHGRIYYSIKRYEAWLESQWECRQGSSSSARASASDSCATATAAAKPSPTRRPRRGSQPQPVFALR
ncbi:hypothetical protein D3C78_911530 [compost metagenome]